MTEQFLLELLKKGEGISIEFKQSYDKLNKDAFDTICSFLNRKGGHLILGVSDNKEIIGINPNAIQNIIDSIVINANNPQKLSPPFYLSPEVLASSKR